MSLPEEQTVFGHVRERFETRARALFYTRLALMSIGLGVLVVPAWHQALHITMPFGVYWYLVLLACHVGSYLWVGRPYARPVVFVTLCLDLLAILYLVAASGGLASPLMPAQLVFTMLFALLFPSPLYLIPPLLTLPVVAKVGQILGFQSMPGDLFLVLWYSALNVTVVYVVVYLDGRERASFREVVRLQRQRRQAALERQRTRMAREIHDSVGASLSGVILQAEYLSSRDLAPEIRREVDELRDAASEGMEELRRAVSLMRQDFSLSPAVSDYLTAFGQRQRLETRLDISGVEPAGLDPERQLVLFRIVQEALTNAARHASASTVIVQVNFEEQRINLSIIDNGGGFDPAQVPPGHYGLQNMRERVARVGGEVKITSAPGEGVSIAVWVPVAEDSVTHDKEG